MNNNTLLISYKTLVETTELNSNIDPKVIQPLIKEVQEMRVQALIGSRLFERLKADIAPGGTLTADYRLLLDEYIRPVLTYNILLDLPFRLNHRFTNAALLTRTAEATNALSNEDLQRTSEHYKSRARWYADRLTDFLCANESKYPEYRQSDKLEELKPKPGQYETGIYLG